MPTDDSASGSGRIALLELQKSGFVAGRRKPIEEFLREQPELAIDQELLLDLIYSEFCLLEESGEQPDPEEFYRRFPALRPQLTQLFEVHSAINKASGDDLNDTLPFEGNALSTDSRFRILRPHAKGGLGEVFVAQDKELHREVALKKIQGSHADRPDSRQRFVLEAEITGGLEHPGIVPVYALGYDADGRPYYAMRFVRGESLQDALKKFHATDADKKREPGQRALELRRLLQRFIDVCDAIEYAHSRGVLHRDLKPDNIMLGNYGETLVVDWGLAKSIARTDSKTEGQIPEPTLRPHSLEDASPTQMGSAVGTPQYMSPEQAAGRLDLLGPASDVYSLGATLYCLLTGKPPFADLANAGAVEVLKRTQRGEFVLPRKVNKRVPPNLEAICLKAMALPPGNRYASPRALSHDLEQWLADEPVSAARETSLQRWARVARRNRAWTIAGAMALMLVSIISLVAAALIERSRIKEVRAYGNEVRALRLAAVTDRFNRGLKTVVWTTQHLDQMDELLAELHSLDYEHLADYRKRVPQELAHVIAASLQAATLAPEDSARIERQLSLLESRDPTTTTNLRQEFAARQRHWEPVFELAAPFRDLPQVFDPTHVRVEDKVLVRKTVDGKGPAARVECLASCAGNVQMQATFPPSWELVPEIGLGFQYDAVNHYEFVMRCVDANVSETKLPTVEGLTFTKVRRNNGTFVFEIRRNGTVLQRQEMPATTVPSGSLNMSIERQRERLVLRTNTLPPLVSLDPFPLKGNAGHFALHWPAGMGLLELRGLRQTLAAQPSPLEAADQLYDEGRFVDALTQYQQIAVRVDDPHVRQESRTKQALCLESLNRTDEAVKLFEQVTAESGEHWPPLAGIHLWLVLERQQKPSEAEAVFDNLSARFGFAQLATAVPGNLRDELIANHMTEFANLFTVYQLNEPRLRKMERMAAIDRFLSPDGQGQEQVQIKLLRAYMFASDIKRALHLAEQLYRRNGNYETLRNFVRILIWSGNGPKALKELDDHFASQYDSAAPPSPGHLLSHARVNALLENWPAAEQDLDRALQGAPNDLNIVADVFLMRGFLLERRGHSAAAMATFRVGFERTKAYMLAASPDQSGAIRALILGSLSGELTGEMAFQRLGVMVGKGKGQAALQAIKVVVGSDIIGTALADAWRSQRGRQVAEQTYVFDTVPMGEQARLIAQMLAAEGICQDAFGDNLSTDQRGFVGMTANQLYKSFFDRNDVNSAQAMQVLLSWKGTTGFLGWGGVAPSLSPELRAPLGYVLGHRLLQLKNRKEAERLWREAQREAPPESLLARLVEIDLKLLADNRGRLNFSSDRGLPLKIRVRREEEEVALVDVTDVADVRLPPGKYQMALVGEYPGVSIDHPEIDLAVAATREIRITWTWKASHPPFIQGLASNPARLSPLGPWQVMPMASTTRINTLAWSADNTQLACGVVAGEIRIYDALRRQLINILPGHANGVNSLDWSAVHHRLASAGVDGKIRIWRDNGTLEHILSGHTAGVNGVAWSPDGKLLASVGGDGTIRLWSTTDPEPRVLRGHTGNIIYAVAWSPDGQRLATCGMDTTIRIWNVDGSEGPILTGHTGFVKTIAWCRDGKRIVSGADDATIRMWNLQTQDAKIIPKHGGGVTALAWNADGTKLVSGGDGLFAGLWDTDGQAGPKLAGHKAPIQAVAWSHDGKQLVTGDRLGTLQFWDAAGQPTSSIVGMNTFGTVAWSPDGRQIAAGGSDRTVRLWDANGQPRHVLHGHDGLINMVVWNPHDGGLASGSSDGTARLWLPDGSAGPILKGNRGSLNALEWDPDGKNLRTSSFNGTVCVWGADGTAGPIANLDTTTYSGFAWGRGPIAWLAGNGTGDILTWDANHQPRPAWKGHASRVHTLAWNPQGTRLASGCSDRTVRLWRADGTIEHTLQGHTHPVNAIGWNSDGSVMATAGADRTIRLWNPLDGTAGLVLKGHHDILTSVSWNPKDQQLVSGSNDGTIRVWDTATGRPQWVASALPDDQSVVFSPGGELLHATAEAERHYVYLVERPDRTIESLTPNEFRARIQQAERRPRK